jgi:hypothetical protein
MAMEFSCHPAAGHHVVRPGRPSVPAWPGHAGTELAAELPFTQQAVTKHLSVLARVTAAQPPSQQP